MVRDADLIHEVRRGSAEALGELFSRHVEMVFTVALRFLCNRAEAEDVVQDVFIALPEALAQYREQGALEAWLRRLTVRASLMRLRQRGRWVPEAHAPLEARFAVQPSTVERITLERALSRLPESLRVVFVLREMEGYTHAEIAQMQAISERASRVRLHRAWQRLRKELET